MHKARVHRHHSLIAEAEAEAEAEAASRPDAHVVGTPRRAAVLNDKLSYHAEHAHAAHFEVGRIVWPHAEHIVFVAQAAACLRVADCIHDDREVVERAPGSGDRERRGIQSDGVCVRGGRTRIVVAAERNVEHELLRREEASHVVPCPSPVGDRSPERVQILHA
jgi:hypothetical protein